MPDVITNNIDLWTSALLTKSTAGRGSNGKVEAYGIKKLRGLILELAVRGKLMPQDPNDEPASVLLKKITKEKAQLAKSGKIKKEKSPPEIVDEDKPYQIPESWQWARLPDIASYKVGKTPSTKNPEYWSDNAIDIPWVSISDMEHFGVLTETNKKITYEAAEKVFGYEPIPKGSLLMSFKLTVGKTAILGIDAFHNEAIISLQPYSGIVRDYLFKMLPTRAQEGNTKRAIMGDTLNSTSLSLLLTPVPPVAEQHRIVAKVDELMALCDQLEQQQATSIEAHQTLVETLLGTLTSAPVRAEPVEGRASTSSARTEFEENWTRIADHFDTLFTTEQSIDQLKQTILQLAVMGKLVPQDPNDESARVLLEKVVTEKDRLVREGITKKEKPVPEILDEEKPFELPETWEWTRLGKVVHIRGGKRVSNGYQFLSTPTPYIYIRVSDMKDGSIDDSELMYIDEKMHSKISQYIITKDDIYMTIVGATIGKCGLVPGKFDGMNLTENAARLTPCVVSKYYLYTILSGGFCQDQFLDKTKQVGVQKMALNRLASTILPLPPLAEQHRIVAKVDELMALCDALKVRLADAQTTQIHLADTIVEQAVA